MDYNIISDIVENIFGDIDPIIKAYEKYYLMMSFPPEIHIDTNENMPIGKIYWLDS